MLRQNILGAPLETERPNRIESQFFKATFRPWIETMVPTLLCCKGTKLLSSNRSPSLFKSARMVPVVKAASPSMNIRQPGDAFNSTHISWPTFGSTGPWPQLRFFDPKKRRPSEAFKFWPKPWHLQLELSKKLLVLLGGWSSCFLHLRRPGR